MLGLVSRINAKKRGVNLFTTSFCGDSSFRDKVINTLYGNLPSAIIDIIKWRYDEMRNNLFTSHLSYPSSPFSNTTVLTNTKDVLLEIDQTYFSGVSCLNHIWQYPNVGHDLPIWLDRPLDKDYPNEPEDAFDFKNQKRIMIIAQDPLRSIGGVGKMYISSVFGLHSKDWRRDLTTTKIFNKLLKEQCCLYLTDYNKFFVEGRTKSNKHVKFLTGNFQKMLFDEISLFHPDLIVTWGQQASYSLLNKYKSINYFPTNPTPYNFNGIKVLPVYHTNYRMSMSYINDKKYDTKVNLYINEILNTL